MHVEQEFTQRGGVWSSVIYATWPFAKIFATPEKITLKVFWKEYSLEGDQIIDLREYHGMFSKGMLIEYNINNYPHRIVFWTFNLEKLKKGLEALGYTIGPPKKSDGWWRGGP